MMSHQANYDHISRHTAQTWAETFITELNDTQFEEEIRIRTTPPFLCLKQLSSAYLRSHKRLIVLGYNATLTTAATETPRPSRRPFETSRHSAVIHPMTLKCIENLCNDEMNTVMIFSGSERQKMEDLFRKINNVWLIAENGVFFKPPCSVVVKTDRKLHVETLYLRDRLKSG